MDAVTRGTSEGLQLPLTIIAMLIVLVAMVVFVVFAQPVSGPAPSSWPAVFPQARSAQRCHRGLCRHAAG